MRGGGGKAKARIAVLTVSSYRSLARASMVRVTLPRIRLVEVGPRDGLQNERLILSASLKIQLIQRLVQAGLRNVESGAFVSPRWVPQMATTPEVISSPLLRDLRERYGDSLSLPVLVPNMQGLQALSKILFETDQMRKGQIPVTNEISIFISATESFSQANLNCSVRPLPLFPPFSLRVKKLSRSQNLLLVSSRWSLKRSRKESK